MASDEQEVKPLENGFPPLHLLATSGTTATSAAISTSAAVTTAASTSSAIPVSLIPLLQANMFASPGLVGLPINQIALSQQALLQASVQHSLFNLAANKAAQESKTKEQKDVERVGARKRKSSTPQCYQTTEPPMKLLLCQQRTSKGKVYSWMHNGLPKRQRAKISDETKREIVEFCKVHTMLKQGEIADIFGVDRTTVTKMLKRSQDQEDGILSEYQISRKPRDPQYELEDMLYRWISNTTKHNPENKPVWSCAQMLEQANELQRMTDTGNDFSPTLDWLLDFVSRFRLKRLITDYPDARSSGTNRTKWTTQPGSSQSLQNATGHKIPREKMPKYTIVETPLDLQVKIEPMEPKQESEEEPVQELTDSEARSRELKTLEKFREQQKAIEEANKMKKALLSKTLTERKQRAKQEAHKLEHIQKELAKLDDLLTADVQVIRGKIEEASRDFMEAQKRFEKAEKEYIESKVELHNKAELKEQLTEHLYTIIHQNEVRKAKKLADLMKELEMEFGDDDEELQLPQLPPLTSFQPAVMPLSPTGLKSSKEQSQFKIVEDKTDEDCESSDRKMQTGEICDKNSNTIVIKPVSPECSSNSQKTDEEINSQEEQITHVESADIDKASYTIVEDGTINVVFESDDSEKQTENNKSKKGSQEKIADRSLDVASDSQTVKPKTKWDFDGTVS